MNFIIHVYMKLFNKLIEVAARNYGLPDAELFQTVDLFEKRNIPQVTQCIHALGRHVSDAFNQVIHLFLGFYFRHKKRTLVDQHSDLKCLMLINVTFLKTNYVLDKA